MNNIKEKETMTLTHNEHKFIDRMIGRPEFQEWYNRYQYEQKEVIPFRELTEQEQLGACYDFECFLWEKNNG